MNMSMYFCEFDPPNFSSDSPKTDWPLLKRSCTKFSNARTVLIKYQLLKCLFFAAPQKYFSCQSSGLCYLLAMSIYQFI